MSTWTYQADSEAPVSYFSAAPWTKQERAKTSKGTNRLYAPFRGRTTRDMDRLASGASLPPDPRAEYCECGCLRLHSRPDASEVHRERMAAKETREKPDPKPHGGLGVPAVQMLQRASQDVEFAR